MTIRKNWAPHQHIWFLKEMTLKTGVKAADNSALHHRLKKTKPVILHFIFHSITVFTVFFNQITVSLSLSLSLSIYIYMCIYIYIHNWCRINIIINNDFYNQSREKNVSLCQGIFHSTHGFCTNFSCPSFICVYFCFKCLNIMWCVWVCRKKYYVTK